MEDLRLDLESARLPSPRFNCDPILSEWMDEYQRLRELYPHPHAWHPGFCYVFPTVSALPFLSYMRNSHPHFCDRVATIFSSPSSWVRILLPSAQKRQKLSTEFQVTPLVSHSEGVKICPQTKTRKLAADLYHANLPTGLLHLLSL